MTPVKLRKRARKINGCRSSIKESSSETILILYSLAVRIVLLLFFSIGTAIGQSITGIVVEADGIGIPDAHIRVTNTTIGTYTDKDGKFRLSNIPTGAILQVSSVGFAQVEFPATDTLISIELKPSLQYLSQNIVVTAQRYETNQFDVSEPVTVLNSSDLAQQAPRSTPEALFGSAGIWIQKTNHGGGSPIIRGLVGNHILLMMDGIRLNNATYRYGPNQYLSTIDQGLVERIEATRGNGSVLYGSDALGGVVQIL
jgi:iron complex outermembrane receptor protein/hemoglobin/transferrin/lactoferrin receptor protein